MGDSGFNPNMKTHFSRWSDHFDKIAVSLIHIHIRWRTKKLKSPRHSPFLPWTVLKHTRKILYNVHGIFPDFKKIDHFKQENGASA